MRKPTLRDILATLVVAAVVVPFIGCPVRGSMPFAHGPRGMAGVGIAGCLLTFAVRGRGALGTGTFERVMMTLGVLTLGSGIAALIAETTWALLVPMVAGLVIIWAAALLHDTGYIAPAHAVTATPERRSPAGPALAGMAGRYGPAAGYPQPGRLPGHCGRTGLLFRAGPGSS